MVGKILKLWKILCIPFLFIFYRRIKQIGINVIIGLRLTSSLIQWHKDRRYKTWGCTEEPLTMIIPYIPPPPLQVPGSVLSNNLPCQPAPQLPPASFFKFYWKSSSFLIIVTSDLCLKVKKWKRTVFYWMGFYIPINLKLHKTNFGCGQNF